MQTVENVDYGLFIVPGLMMLSLLTQSISNASFGIYFPKFTGTIYEIMSAPISFWEIIIGYVGAATSKSLIIGIIILVTANLFVDIRIAHPVIMLIFLVMTCVSFSLLGFIIGLWADSFEKLQLIPLLVITLSGFRWSFFEVSDVNVAISLAVMCLFLFTCMAVVWFMFKTGYKLKQ